MITETPTKDNVACVVVTYFPDKQLPHRINEITKQFSNVLIVDNHSDIQTIHSLKELSINEHINLILNKENLGIATALNQGMQWAKEHNYIWLLTMDQDTILYDGALETFADVYASCSKTHKPAIIGSNYIDKLTGVPFINDSKDQSKTWTEAITVITSGSLVSLNTAEIIGPFRDDYFIDHVDDEYCLRARLKGFDVIITVNTLMEHTVGSPIEKKCFGKKLITPNMSPERQYYRTRNHIKLIKQYRRSQPEWIKQSIKTRIKEIVLILLIEKNKFLKMRRITQGFIDAIRGRMGRLA